MSAAGRNSEESRAMMTPDVGEISNVWDYVNPLDEAALSKSFHAAKPFRFICLDDFLNSEFCHEVCQAYPSYRDAERNAERQFLAVNENRKLQIVDSERFPKAVRILKDALAAPELLQTLSRITGIPDLQADPELAGGGMHVMGPGSRLDVHVDFNMLVERKLHRRLNIVLYLNEGWQET